MKKISILLAILASGILFFTSCTKDTTDPTINFLGGAGYTSADATIAAGSDIKVGITAQSGSAKLSGLKIVATYNNIPQNLLDTTFSSDTFTRDFIITLNDLGETRLKLTIMDKDGGSAEASLVITVVGAISTYTQKILGSYDNSTYGSSFASADGTVYKIKDARDNSTKVDWLYFYGVTNQATLAAPDDADAADIFDGTNGLQTWAKRNATRFAKVTAGAVWDNINTAADIAAIATNTTLTKANMLEEGHIVAFKTEAGKLGLIKVGEIVAGGAGTITYDVKVQQ